MTPVALRFRMGLLVLAGTHACCAWLGWTLRDRSADLAIATVQTAQQASRADAAQAESQRLAAQAERTRQFQTLQQDIETHAKTPGRDRGDADAEFVRIWREANAGRALSR